MEDKTMKTCDQCAARFTPFSVNQKFCGPACRTAARNARARRPAEHKACLECGGTFTTANGAKVYCCRACLVLATTKRYRTPKPLVMVCPNCAKQFAREHHNQRYCSYDCQRRKNPLPVECVVCVVCKTTFTSSRRDAKTCSDNCRAERQLRYEKMLQRHRKERLDAAFGDA